MSLMEVCQFSIQRLLGTRYVKIDITRLSDDVEKVEVVYFTQALSTPKTETVCFHFLEKPLVLPSEFIP